MTLKDFHHNDFINTDLGLGKVIYPEKESVTVKLKDGSLHEVSKVSRVYLSMNQFLNVPGYVSLEPSCFAIPPMPGYVKFNYTEMCFEWIVESIVVRKIDYLDQLQGIYKHTTGKDLFNQ